MTTLLRLIKAIALGALMCLGMSTAQATDCPHTVDLFLTEPSQPTVPLTTQRSKVIPRGNVNLTGMMLFNLRIGYYSGGDSCIVTFEAANGSRSIGGGLTMTWGKVFVLRRSTPTYSDAWDANRHALAGCGELFPTHGTRYIGRGEYKWNGAFGSIKPANTHVYMAYESYCAHQLDKFWVPFTITGNYNGDTISLKPVPAITGPWANTRWNYGGWYVIAAGESSRRFNPHNSFWSNSSTTDPLVLRTGGCTSSSLSPPQNSSTYTTQSNIGSGGNVELAKFTTSRNLSNCAFSSGDTIHFNPRSGQSSSPFELTSSTTLSNTKSEEVYKFKCLHCVDTSQFESIEMRITRTLSGRKDDNSSCDMQSSVAASRIIAASNLSTCTSIKLETEVRFVQTAHLLNTKTSSDQSNLQPIYKFTKADIGSMVFTANTSTSFGSTDDLAKSDIGFTAPVIFGCADLATTYENSLPDVIKGLLNPAAGKLTTIGSFKTTTKANKCALQSADMVNVTNLALPSGTPLALVSTTASGVKTLVRTYKMACNTCSDATKPEGVTVKVTQTLDASKGNLACGQRYSVPTSTLRMSNLQACDTINLVNQVELLQSIPMLGQQPYDFAPPLATFDLSVPLIGGQNTSTIGLSNKAFKLVAPLQTEVCRVVLQSAIQRK